MDIKIHRGLDQIGGCITEISTATSRIFIDMGQNLPGTGKPTTPAEDQKMVEDLFAQNKKTNEAVFYTHAHEDHVGLFCYVPKDVPQYIGAGAKEILMAKYGLIKKGMMMNENVNENENWLAHENEDENVNDNHNDDKIALINKKIRMLKAFKTWERTKPRCVPKSIEIGDIKITPFFCCHSIYDAYMFLIEADGKRVWHTGDFREHGYLGKGLMPTLEKYATNIDTLICEGTNLDGEEKCKPEKFVTEKIYSFMTLPDSNRKYIVVLTSATDIERLASIKNVAKKLHRDLYITGAFMKKTMQIFTRREAKASRGLFEFHPKYVTSGDKRIESMRENSFFLVTSVTHLDFVKNLIEGLDEYEVMLMYCCWDGYYQIPEQVEANPQYKNFRDLFHQYLNSHTSGHADRQTIRKVVETVRAKEVILIHKNHGAEL